MMRRFRRSPVSCVETPVTAEVTSPTLLLPSSSPPLMSRLNRSALRRCRTLFSRHLDLDCLIDADDYFRFGTESLMYESRTSVTTFLDSLEQTGNDLSFERFVDALRVNQRHLAAVLDETRNQLRTWQCCFFRRESYNNLVAGSDEQNDYILSPFDDDDSMLTGEEIRRIISRHVAMTTTSCGNNSVHAQNGATELMANRAVATHVESENSDSCDAISDYDYPNDVTYLSTNSFIDCFSAVNRVDHKNRKWVKHGRGNDAKAATSSDSVATYFETDAAAEQVEGHVTTWSATLVRNLEFRRIDRDKLSPEMPTPPEGYRSVYIIANDNSSGGPKSESNKQIGGGYASVTRRSQSFAFGNDTNVDVVPSGFELELDNSFFRDGSALHPGQRNTPPIPPKPKVFETGTGECSSLGRHSVPSRLKNTKPGLSSLPKYGSPTPTNAEIPPPLPARINLSTTRRASLPPPPPPPPPRGTQMSSPTSSGHVTRPLSTSTSMSSSPGFVPDQRASNTCVENGPAWTTDQQQLPADANAENNEDEDDIDELDRQISAASSLSQLNSARDDNEHVPLAENKRTKVQPVEDDYEPISAVKGGVANGIVKQSLITSSTFAVSSSSGSLVEEIFGACNGIFQKSETKSTLANSHKVVAEIHRGPEIKNEPPKADTPTSGNENEQQLDIFVPSSGHVTSFPASNGADNDVSRINESIADFMQQSLNGEPRAGGGSGVGQLDKSPEPEVNTISPKSNSKPEIAWLEKLQNGADWIDEDESIVYEDIDQYQTDDTADDAYLDPATSSSLSGRIRLLKAELLKQQRGSGNATTCQPDGGSRTQPIRGVLRRSSTVGPASSVRTGNGYRLPSSTFAVPHSMRRVLACGSLVVVIESGRVQSPTFDSGSGSNSDGDNRLQSSTCRQNVSNLTAEESTTKPCNDVITALCSTGSGSDETVVSNEQAPPVNASEEVQETDEDKKLKASDSRRPEAQVALALDRDGIAYCIPRSELRHHGDPRGEPWYYPISLSLRQATLFISCERQEGCFLLYKPSSGIDSPGNKSPIRYILSVGRSDGQVLHYPVLGSVGSQGLYVKGDRRRRTFLTLADMVDYFRHNRGRLATRLRRPLREARWPPIFDLVANENDERKYEIGRDQLQLTGDGNGRVVEFGLVCIGNYKQSSSAREIQVAVKVLQRTPFASGEGSFDQQIRQLPSKPPAGTPSYCDSISTTADDDDFVAEARLLSTLHHDNIIRLIGVSLARRPFYLVTELCQYGQLHRFLQNRRKRRQTATANQVGADEQFSEPGSFHLAICRQAAEAVAYLEQRQYVIHRNVSAASFDVSFYTGDVDDVGFGVGRRRASARTSRQQPGGDCGIVVKLADFSRARSVVDDEYVGDVDEKVFVKWAAPEVLTSGRYSTKSDVWSLGVLFWEVYSDGTLPYDYLNASETAVYVTNGGRLDRPLQCPAQLYHLALKCWNRKPRDRPSPTTVCNRLLYASATNAWRSSQTNNFATPKTANVDVSLPKSLSMPPGGAATATLTLHNDRSPNRLRMSQSFAAPSSPSPFAAFPLPSATASRPPIDVAQTMTTSSPTLPRHRNRNPIQSFTSFPESELTLTRASAVGNRPRTATPVPRRKFDCSLLEGNEGINGSGGPNELDGDAQSKTPNLEPGQRQDLLAVPDSGRAGSRRSRSNEGLGKAPSKASVSSGESVFLQNSFLANGHTADVRDSLLEGGGSTTPTDLVRADMTTEPSAADAGKGHTKNKAYKKLAYKLIRRPVPTSIQ